jgi:predicted DNA-binding transcriptional regulator YafY
MSALTIDALADAQNLGKRGFTEEQATGVVEALREIDAFELARRADIRELEAKFEAGLESSAARLKVDIIRWLIVTQIALGGFIFAAIKLSR